MSRHIIQMIYLEEQLATAKADLSDNIVKVLELEAKDAGWQVFASEQHEQICSLSQETFQLSRDLEKATKRLRLLEAGRAQAEGK